MDTNTGLSDGYLVGKELVILLFEYVVGKPGVYIGSLNLIASIPGPSIHNLDARIRLIQR